MAFIARLNCCFTRMLADVTSALARARLTNISRPGDCDQSRGRERGHDGPASVRPPRDAARPWLVPGGDRLARGPMLDIIGEGPGGRVAFRRCEGHRLQTHGLKRPVDRPVELARCGKLTPLHLAEQSPDVVILERRAAGQEAVKGRSQRVDVAARSDAVQVAAGLLGAHVTWRPQGATRQGLVTAAARAGQERPFGGVALRVRLTQRLGQAPIDDQGLAVLAEDDVARLQVAVQHAARMCVVNRVTDVDEPPQEPA